MAGTADAVVMLPQTFQAHLEKSGHLDSDQFLDPLPQSGIAEDRRGKAALCGRAVDFRERRVKEGIAAGKGYRARDVFVLAEHAQIIEHAHCLDERQGSPVAPIIAMLAVQIAGLRDMPLKRERRR